MKQRERRRFLKDLGVSSTGILLSGMPAMVSTAIEKPPGPLRRAVLEGPFGRAEVDLRNPSLSRLFLREKDGTLVKSSLLSEHASDFPAWAMGATSYYVDKQGQRYESRFSTSHQVAGTPSRDQLQLSGIRPSTAAGKPLACLEDWRLEVTSTGALRWEIRRHFEHSMEAVLHGGPALFFNVSPNTEGRTPQTSRRLNPAANGLSLSWWVQEEALHGEPLKEYLSDTDHEIWFPANKSVTMRKKNGWAIFKLYPSFRCNSDLMASTRGGYLYRRGKYWSFAEIGVTVGPTAGATFQAGEEGVLAMEISPAFQADSGQQLMVELPDKPMERSLKRFFGGLANAGCLADCEKHILGNECDGYFYAGNMRFHAYALLSSCLRPQALSSASASYETAYRKTLESNFDSVDSGGSVTAGFSHGSGMPELPMSNILGLESTLDCLWPLRTGDIQRRHLRFGGLMDGGMLPPMTFWEVTARCLAGDANGAYDLLKRFSVRAEATNWYEGVNAFSLQGSPRGWDGDPFLADQLIVAASVIHGFFGVKYDWAGFEVHPHLPDHWEEAQAHIMFKGVEYAMTVSNGGESTVEPVF